MGVQHQRKKAHLANCFVFCYPRKSAFKLAYVLKIDFEAYFLHPSSESSSSTLLLVNGGAPVGLARDEESKKIYVYSEKGVSLLEHVKERHNVYKFYLSQAKEENDFVVALKVRARAIMFKKRQNKTNWIIKAVR